MAPGRPSGRCGAHSPPEHRAAPPAPATRPCAGRPRTSQRRSPSALAPLSSPGTSHFQISRKLCVGLHAF